MLIYLLDPRFHATILLAVACVRSLFRSKRVSLLVDSLYSKVIESVKLQAGLSLSLPGSIWILGEINSQQGFEPPPNL